MKPTIRTTVTRTLSITLRIIFWIVVFRLGFALAEAVEGVEVTAPLLIQTGMGALMILVVGRAMLRMMRWMHTPALPTHTFTLENSGTAPLEPQLMGEQLIAIRRRRALHEAGHAVVAAALGHRIIRTTIAPEGESGGHVVWVHSQGLNASEDHIAIAFAGVLTQGDDRTSRPTRNHDDDHSMMLRTAVAASVSDPENRAPTQILDAGTRSARRLVAAHPEAIDALTQALLATHGKYGLDEDEVGELMRQHRVVPRATPEGDRG